MNGFENANRVEAEGMAILLPYLDEAADGRVVLTNKGILSRFLQLSVGDALMNDRSGVMWSVEIKIERKHTNNLFLESWSNKNLKDRRSHGERGSTMGWLYHCRADALMYYFLDSDDLYLFNLFRLKQWAFGANGTTGRIYDFKEVPQQKYNQLNDTHGRIVPIDVLRDEVTFKHCRVRQLALWEKKEQQDTPPALTRGATFTPNGLPNDPGAMS